MQYTKQTDMSTQKKKSEISRLANVGIENVRLHESQTVGVKFTVRLDSCPNLEALDELNDILCVDIDKQFIYITFLN